MVERAEGAVEVVFALPDRQEVREVNLNGSCTLREAVQRSGILECLPGIDLEQASCGVFGQRRPLDWVLADGDRVEIYRPLLLNPSEARRLRAKRRRSGA